MSAVSVTFVVQLMSNECGNKKGGDTELVVALAHPDFPVLLMFSETHPVGPAEKASKRGGCMIRST